MMSINNTLKVNRPRSTIGAPYQVPLYSTVFTQTKTIGCYTLGTF